MFELLLPDRQLVRRGTPAALTAFLLHAVIVAAALDRTASSIPALPQVHRDTFRLEMSEVPPSPRPWHSAPAFPGPPPPPIDLGLLNRQALPSLRLSTGDVPNVSPSHGVAPTTGRPVVGDSLLFDSSQMDDDRGPELLSQLQPTYPEGLRQAGVSGFVRLEYVVKPDGRIDTRTMRVLSSTHPGFVIAATQALGRARFKPAQRAGHPAPVLVQQTIRFSAQ